MKQFLDKDDGVHRHVLDYFAADVDVGGRPFRWTTLGIVLNSGMARTIYLLPVLGYALLYSDFFSGVFSFSHILPSWGFLTFIQRLNMLYFGACLLLFSYLLYFFYCPRLLHGKVSAQDFVDSVIAARDSGTMRHVIRDIGRFLSAEPGEDTGKFFEQLTNLLRREGPENNLNRYSEADFNGPFPLLLHFYYNYQNQSRTYWRAIIFFLTVLAYALLALPALDIFVRVVTTTIQHWRQ